MQMLHRNTRYPSSPDEEPNHHDLIYKDSGLDPPEVTDTKTLNRQSSLITLYLLDQAIVLIQH